MARTALAGATPYEANPPYCWYAPGDRGPACIASTSTRSPTANEAPGPAAATTPAYSSPGV